MADAIISSLVQRLTDIIVEQIRNEVNLVRGVKKEVIDLSDNLKRLRNILDDAERRRFKDRSVKDWLKKLEDACYEMEYVLDEWDFTILQQKFQQSNAVVAPKQKVCSFIPSPSSCLHFKKVSSRSHIAKKIVQVKAQLDTIFKEKEQYDFTMSQPDDNVDGLGRVQSTSFVEVGNVRGRDRDKDNLLRKFIPEESSLEELGIHIISVVGSGGIGKTTLAQLVYNDNQVKDSYELRVWICVSDPFNLLEIVKGMLLNVNGSSPDTNQLDMLLRQLKNSIQGKKFLLVLDDVWTEDSTKWEPLKICLSCGAVGSKLLVTTRNERVAKMMGCMENEIYRLGLLSDDDCWLLLSYIAFFGRSEAECAKFNDTGRKIANKCKGLPLAAKTLGSLLRFKDGLEEWEIVLESEIWELEETEVEIFPHLLLSYHQLSPPLKRCFSYCAVFPKDDVITVEILIRNWLSLGYLDSDGNTKELEIRGREYFDNLAMRSLFQDFTRDKYKENVIVKCKMHDIVHDFAQFLRKNTSSGEVKEPCETCNPSLVSRVKEFGSLFFGYKSVPYICDCLARLRVLELVSCVIESFPKGLEKLIHLRHLNLSHNHRLTLDDLKTVFKLYNLKFLLLSHCNLEEIPMEIGNLIKLRHLDLSFNKRLKELPESICDLHELRTLNIDLCEGLSGLPQGIHKLINLKHLHIEEAFYVSKFPDQEIGQLAGLRTLIKFDGKLSWLKKLNQISGSLYLIIPKMSDDEDMVEEAKEAELFKKAHLDELKIKFDVDENNEDVVERVLDAMKPHPNLSYLQIWWYIGPKLPHWFTSPLRQLKHIIMFSAHNLTTLPPLGKLPYLEKLQVGSAKKLEFLGRDFLGLTKDTTCMESSSSPIIGFPKLKILLFHGYSTWREWEDITAEEEASTGLLFFPCLKRLDVVDCPSLTMLPHRLLSKASSLQVLNIYHSTQLKGQYDKRKDGSSWKFISHIPQVGI